MPRPIPTILLNDTRIDRHHGCSRVMAAIEGLLSRIGCEILARVPAHSDWHNDPSVSNAVDAARLVVVNGEGTIHHDRPAGRRLLQAGAWAKSRGIPAALINMGWEANSADMAGLARKFALVSVRDSRSATQLREAGVDCRVVPDLSLYCPGVDTHGQRKGLLFTDSVNRTTTVSLDQARRRTDSQWLPIQYQRHGLAGAIRFLREGVARRDVTTPAFAARMLMARSAMLGTQQEDSAGFLNQLAHAQLLVSGRFHACTLAILAETPFVAVASNTPKIASLIMNAGLRSWRAASSLEPSDLQDAMRLGWESGELDACRNYVSHARTSADALFSDIRGLA